MTLYTQQAVSNVNMHIDGREATFDVKPSTGFEDHGRVTVKVTDWNSSQGHQFTLFATDEQLQDLEHALHVYNLERTMERDENGHVHVNRSERVPA